MIGRHAPDHFPARPLVDRDLVLALFNRRPIASEPSEPEQRSNPGPRARPKGPTWRLARFFETAKTMAGGRRQGLHGGQHAGMAMAEIAGDRPEQVRQCRRHPTPPAGDLGPGARRAEDMHRLAGNA